MSKPFILVVFFCLFSLIGMSQDWQTDFKTAKTISKEENKPILLVFQGSDWCAPCIKLDREIWTTSIFKKYASENYVMLKADFPRKAKNALSKEQTKANSILAENYNKKGIFPLVVLLDPDGNELGQTSYKRTTPENYIKELNRYLN